LTDCSLSNPSQPLFSFILVLFNGPRFSSLIITCLLGYKECSYLEC
jgi:hypothetical protein